MKKTNVLFPELLPHVVNPSIKPSAYSQVRAITLFVTYLCQVRAQATRAALLDAACKAPALAYNTTTGIKFTALLLEDHVADRVRQLNASLYLDRFKAGHPLPRREGAMSLFVYCAVDLMNQRHPEVFPAWQKTFASWERVSRAVILPELSHV